jgi:hypothetical protein
MRKPKKARKAGATGAKVFCFFFSKKETYLLQQKTFAT